MMTDHARRKELSAQYKQAHPEAGVYILRNNRNGKVLLGSTLNLASMRSKLEFARSTNSLGALDHRLRNDLLQFGVDAFSLEVLEALQPAPEMTPADIRQELATLEQLHRESFEPKQLY
ncbi:MAG TPA: GIY-YIG nuclease family protein [Nitrolancea sp.]|nr:GIY-YIG nuclease family protein [Nitrolancea sp.]